MSVRAKNLLSGWCAVLTGALLLGGCAGDGSLTEAVRSARGGAAVPETPQFVRESRPAEPSTYIPVGVTPPSRPTPVKNASDVKKLEDELDGQRNRAKAFAHRPAPKSTYDGSIPRPPKAGLPAPAAQE